MSIYIFGFKNQDKSETSKKEMIKKFILVLDLFPNYIKFLLVGGLGAIINITTLILLILMKMPHIIASATAIEISIITNFLLHDNWTFRKNKKGKWWNRLLKFHTSSISAVMVQWVASNLLHYFFNINSIIAQFIGIALGFILNYKLSKKFVWVLENK